MFFNMIASGTIDGTTLVIFAIVVFLVWLGEKKS